MTSSMEDENLRENEGALRIKPLLFFFVSTAPLALA